jgi:ferredoxin
MKKEPLFKLTPLFLLPRPWDAAAERFLEKLADVPRLPDWAAHKRCRDCGAASFHCPSCGTKIAFADTVLEIHEGDCLHCRREVSTPCARGRARSFLRRLTGK